MSEAPELPVDVSELGAALHMLALQELRVLCEALEHITARHRRVHEARKAIRRLRSLLLLGRNKFGRHGAKLDAQLKILANSLSELRDAHVVVEISARIGRKAKDADARHRWKKLQRQLAVRRKLILHAVLNADPAFAGRRDEVARLGGTLDILPWHMLDTGDIQESLARSLRRVMSAEMIAISSDASAENRHRWRRRLRRLRMQWSLLKVLQKQLHLVATSNSAHHVLAWLRDKAFGFKQASHVADALGIEQDLGLLHTALLRLPGSRENEEAQRELLEMLKVTAVFRAPSQ
jgi:CHAD domain-containing protein